MPVRTQNHPQKPIAKTLNKSTVAQAKDSKSPDYLAITVVFKWKWRSNDAVHKQYIVHSVTHTHTWYRRIFKTIQWHEKAKQHIRGTLAVTYGNKCAHNCSSNQPRQGLQEHTTLTQHDYALKCLIELRIAYDVYYDWQSSLGARLRPGICLENTGKFTPQCLLWHPPTHTVLWCILSE